MPELRPDPDFDAAAVEQLGAKRLAELIVKETYRNAGVAQALRLALASLQSDDMLAEALAEECRMLRRDDVSTSTAKPRFLLPLLNASWRASAAIYCHTHRAERQNFSPVSSGSMRTQLSILTTTTMKSAKSLRTACWPLVEPGRP